MMTEFAIRLRSFRPKMAGASVHVLPTHQPNYGESWRGKMIENAKTIAGYEGDLVGYVVIGLWEDGSRSCGYRTSPKIPRELFPSYIAEILRCDAITDHAAGKVFDKKFFWQEGGA